MSCVRCSAGGQIAAAIPLERILDNILECHLADDGKVDEEVEHDALCFVKQVWTKLMEDAYLVSLDSHAVREIQQAHRLWEPPLNAEGHPLPGCKSLMQDWCDAIAKLTRRLANIGTFKPDQGECSL